MGKTIEEAKEFICPFMNSKGIEVLNYGTDFITCQGNKCMAWVWDIKYDKKSEEFVFTETGYCKRLFI